jgi:hypothetical protein
LTGIGGGEEEVFVWTRGVEAGRVGTETGPGTVNVEERVGIVALRMVGEVG